jgi:hypothetical protein
MIESLSALESIFLEGRSKMPKTKYLYKLTDENGYSGFAAGATRTRWAPGIAHEIAPYMRNPSANLCSSSYFHAYEHPLLAAFMNPAHGAFKQPLLWKCKGQIEKRESDLKCGTFALTAISTIDLPVLTITQRVKIAIYCSLTIPQNKSYKNWAKNWLSGKNRSYEAATAAAAANADAANAAYAAYTANAAAYAAYAAYAAANAANAAANAAYAANAAAYAYAAAADDAAAYAASATAYAAANFSLLEIIRKVLLQKES